VLVALDDTDGPGGGCTTHVAARLAARLGEAVLEGRPRLVRLDPANPHKTRGNAALVLPLRDELDPAAVLESAADLVDEHARVAEGKGAGVAVLEAPPDPAWYDRGVRSQVPLEAARGALEGARTATLGTGRGLVGALCAAAWRPGEREHTYTRIAYREPERRGTPRDVATGAARELADHPDLFDTWDARDEHAVVAPRTPCPVLVGVRATRPGPLADAVELLAEEPVARAVTFVTNQATDDHLAPADVAPATVQATPDVLDGGHVRVPAERDGEAVDLMAFAPTGDLRAPLRQLVPGDRVLPVGGGPHGQVNLEKALVVPRERADPVCPGCQGRLASTGRGRVRRCPRCGTRRPAPVEEGPARWVEADASARRHLARPLALGLVDPVAGAARELVDDSRPRPRTRAEAL